MASYRIARRRYSDDAADGVRGFEGAVRVVPFSQPLTSHEGVILTNDSEQASAMQLVGQLPMQHIYIFIDSAEHCAFARRLWYSLLLHISEF